MVVLCMFLYTSVVLVDVMLVYDCGVMVLVILVECYTLLGERKSVHAK